MLAVMLFVTFPRLAGEVQQEMLATTELVQVVCALDRNFKLVSQFLSKSLCPMAIWAAVEMILPASR